MGRKMLRAAAEGKAWVHQPQPVVGAFDGFVGYQLHKAALRFVDRQHPAWREAGLGPAQFAVLIALTEMAAPNQLALGRELRIEKVAMVRLIDDLEARGAVARTVDAADRRQRRLSLTPAGRELAASLRLDYERAEDELLAGLSAPERAGLLAALRTINR